MGLYFVYAGVGIFFGICAVLMLLFYKAGYKKTGDDTILTKRSIDVAAAYRKSILDYLAGLDVEPEINKQGVGGVDLLEVYFNRETGVLYAQHSVFSNYKYEPDTEMVELHRPQSDKLISKL